MQERFKRGIILSLASFLDDICVTYCKLKVVVKPFVQMQICRLQTESREFIN